MSQKNKIQLQCSRILQVPLQIYPKDFKFIINGDEFETNHFISDLLSSKISQMHFVDPTIDSFTINTKERGDFSRFLQLVDFKISEIPENELQFVHEVLEILDNDDIKVEEEESTIELTTENIFKEIQKHESNQISHLKRYNAEIEFITSHLSELLRTREEDLMNVSLCTLEEIFKNENLSIENEDELLQFVNKLYKRDSTYSILYEFIYFENVTSEGMSEFIDVYDINDINRSIWTRLCERLLIENTEGKNEMKRHYKKTQKVEVFAIKDNEPFDGIFNHLRIQTNNNINDEIKVTASSIFGLSSCYQPSTVVLKENKGSWFISNDEPNSWLMIDFKDHRIIPTDYTIRTADASSGDSHPKSWAIEVSNDEKEWSIIDEVNDCEYLNGSRLVHTFRIQQQQSEAIRYFRIRQTGPSWSSSNRLLIETIEIFGTLI